MIQLLTDSAADLTAQELQALQITVIPLGVHFGADAYLDGRTLDRPTFYRLLQSSAVFPTTSQPSPADFESCFSAARAKGDDVVAVLLSSALSGTFQGACIAREMMDPEDATHIHLVDSLSATVGERFLLLHAAALRDRGASAAEIAAELTELRRRITIWASVDTLEYLCKGGRLSRTAAGVGSLAKVKPIITLTREGRVAVQKKCIGKSRCMSEITALTEKRRPDPSHPVLACTASMRTTAAHWPDGWQRAVSPLLRITIWKSAPLSAPTLVPMPTAWPILPQTNKDAHHREPCSGIAGTRLCVFFCSSAQI